MWQAVERSVEVFNHILLNRQIKTTQWNLQYPEISDRNDLQPLMNKVVPKAAMTMKLHLERPTQLSHRFINGQFQIEDQGVEYRVNPSNYKCSCPFYTENLLPCRHSIHLFQFFSGDMSNFPVENRWSRTQNSLIEIPSTSFTVTRKQYAHNSGPSSFIDVALYACRRLHPSVHSSFVQAIRNFVDQFGPNPTPPYIMNPSFNPNALDSTVLAAASASELLDENPSQTTDAAFQSMPSEEAIPTPSQFIAEETPVHLHTLLSGVFQPTEAVSSTPIVHAAADAEEEVNLFQYPRPLKRRRLNEEPGPSNRPMQLTETTLPAELTHLQRCGECELEESPAEEQSRDFWVACDNCGQWFHWACVFVPGFEENAMCTTCEAQLDLQAARG